MPIDLEHATGMIVTPTPRKIIQLLAVRNTLIALTDESEIWILHGLDAVNSGTDGITRDWRQVQGPPPQEATVTPLKERHLQTTW